MVMLALILVDFDVEGIDILKLPMGYGAACCARALAFPEK